MMGAFEQRMIMRRWRSLAVGLLTLMGAPAAQAAPLSVLPQPASMVPAAGSYAVGQSHLFADSGDAGAIAAAARFRALLDRSGGPTLPMAGDARHAIAFVRDPSVVGAEAYALTVTPAKITIRASGDAGLYYGAETLWQLVAAAKDGRIPAVRIDDRPAFAWRGVMLDSARHFQPVAYVEQLLDRMALAKLNRFHWHLTDDQGWRLPVDNYPRLTEIGAWRTPAGPAGRDPKTGEAVRYGGFYTHDEIRAVVAYAAARHIVVVPEIEMPGHATAAIAAYPALASTATPPTAPSADWGILPNLFNTSDQTFTMLHAVLDQVMALFPGPYIHIGGDESPKGQWQADPRERAKLASLGLHDDGQLQGWFTAQIGAYLEQHGRRLVGWDEILEGGVPADATVMSWHGIDGALAAARSGHDAVLAPEPTFYLDNRQSDSPDEPPGRGEIVDWRRLYDFPLLPATITSAERAHILGVQANLWTEHVGNGRDADRMLWPRAAVVAELGWSPAQGHDWSGFSRRLVSAMAGWRALGWGYDETPLAAEATVTGDQIALRQPARIGTLRYTIDGSAPTTISPAYTAPIPLAQAGDVHAQSSLDGMALGVAARFRIDAASARTEAASAMRQCARKLPLRLADSGGSADGRPIHWVDVMEPCWIWPAAPLDGATHVVAQVAQVPYNFSFGNDPIPAHFAPPRTRFGELEVRQDRCDGPLIAIVPMTAPTRGESEAKAPLAMPVTGPHDLCMTFTQATADPLWVLDRLTLGR